MNGKGAAMWLMVEAGDGLAGCQNESLCPVASSRCHLKVMRGLRIGLA